MWGNHGGSALKRDIRLLAEKVQELESRLITVEKELQRSEERRIEKENELLRQLNKELIKSIGSPAQSNSMMLLPPSPSEKAKRLEKLLVGVFRAGSKPGFSEEDIKEIAKLTDEEREVLLGQLEVAGSDDFSDA